MSSHFRTLTVVVEIDDATELRYPGYLAEVVRRQLEPLAFLGVRVRNEPNPTGEMPPWVSERGAA